MTTIKEPLVSATRKARTAHAKTPLGKLEKLLWEELRWRRKATIARNKLGEVRTEINRFALAAVSPQKGGQS